MNSPKSSHTATETLALLIQGINAGVWDWDIRSGQEWWSNRFYELLGYDDLELEASNENFLNVLLHPDDRERVIEITKLHLRKQLPYRINIRLKNKEGRYQWFETAGQAKFDDLGEPIRMIGSVVNIDQKIRNLNELERSKRFLEETERMAKVGGWDFNLGSDEVRWSKTVYDIHELPHGGNIRIEEAIQYYTEESRQVIREKLTLALEFRIPFDLELQLLTARNNRIWVRVAGKPILNPEGKVVGLMGTFQDINEQKKREIQLEDSLRVISCQNNRMLDFAHIVSHNLRSHTSNLQMMLEVMKITDSSEDRAAIINHIDQISEELNQTIVHLNQVLFVQNNIDQHKQVLNLADYIKVTEKALQKEIEEHDVLLVHDAHECPEVEGHPKYLESILINLVSNAIRYRQPGRAPIITLRSFLEHNKPVLLVSDNGSGIDLSRYASDLFGMYKTFHGNPEARGIGLYLTRNQVEAMGGKIEVSSEPGLGSTFKITFL
ncbi:sensor histidine kinase [Telluribacter sp.]|jgi:PAS domain S-box-containing protein|uniref:sensor histidine kinase n=1 Tax=Telluribacter sp. TaxID=1978767 RepID=UPI002E15E41A|nr:PAS domain-containing protein [Telluribacter sp.]